MGTEWVLDHGTADNLSKRGGAELGDGDSAPSTTLLRQMARGRGTDGPGRRVYSFQGAQVSKRLPCSAWRG